MSGELKYQQESSVAHADECVLRDSGLIIVREQDFWYIRNHDPNETFDFKWGYYIKLTKTRPWSWGSAACGCFAAMEDMGGFATFEEALETCKELESKNV